MSYQNSSGIIFDIMRFAIHDGPGIRTSVFFKGCPLKCWWCHNPESQALEEEILFRVNRCTGCRACYRACPHHAIENKARCTRCGACVEACPTAAREMVGRRVTVQEVLKEALKDQIFFEESGGGVTFTGGEPLMQPEFLLHLAQACGENGIHRTLETCGYGSWQMLEQIAAETDLFLYDLKTMDDTLHKKYTGVSNKVILDNLKKLSQNKQNVIVRVPVIPGFNDDEMSMRRLAIFVSSLNIGEIHLLAYHQAGIDKYASTGRAYLMPETLPPSKEKMTSLVEMLHTFGLKTKIGG